MTLVGVLGGLGPSPSSLVTEMSAERTTGVVSVSLSSVGSGSLVPVVATVAVFVTEAPVKEALTLTTYVIVALWPGPGETARFGRLQLIEPLVSVHDTPAEPATDTKLVLAGRLSDTVIPVAVVPLAAVLVLVTVIV